jgi:FeS assembly SUF system protein
MSNQNILIQKRKEVISILKTIFDPEIPVNIWDLGLVYGVDYQDEIVTVTMTLTSPNCPAIDTLPEQIRQEIENLESVKEVFVELVWEPAWSKSLMTEEARLELGMI